MVNLHFDCNHFTILESKFNFALKDGDFFNQEADQFLIKLDEAALVGLEERLDVFEVGAIDIVVDFLLDKLFALFS